MMRHILPLDPARYARHAIHTADRTWPETNCYVDVWIELLHAHGFDPVPALPFTVAVDFEGDQWTFFKFRLGDLEELYGLTVEELAVWRPLVRHVEEQVALGRPVLVELDSYYLPDTAGSAYQREHVKSTVAVNAIDVPGQRMEYFHNQGYFALHGSDFDHVFRLAQPRDPAFLPPYVEFVKPRPAVALKGDRQVRASLGSLRRHLSLLPATNPFPRFKARFESDLRWLAEEPLETFHQYAFATVRQFGACYELAHTYLRWLADRAVPGLAAPSAAFAELSAGAKTLQFNLARAMARKRPLDLTAVDVMARRWEDAVTDLKRALL